MTMIMRHSRKASNMAAEFIVLGRIGGNGRASGAAEVIWGRAHPVERLLATESVAPINSFNTAKLEGSISETPLLHCTRCMLSNFIPGFIRKKSKFQNEEPLHGGRKSDPYFPVNFDCQLLSRDTDTRHISWATAARLRKMPTEKLATPQPHAK
ncbi:hypothetical protein ACLOJK_013634 [Asimina triloba]